jgi:hypothetical protein
MWRRACAGCPVSSAHLPALFPKLWAKGAGGGVRLQWFAPDRRAARSLRASRPRSQYPRPSSLLVVGTG